MNNNNYITWAKEVFDIEIEGLKQVCNNLDNSFNLLVEMCLKTVNQGGKLVVSGIGKSAHIGRKISATLSSTGSPSVFLYPVEAMHGDLGMLSDNDLLIAISYSGETDELITVLPAAKRFGISVVAICGNNNSRLCNWSDLVVNMQISREACPFNLAPTTSTTALLALGDALAMVLLKQQGFAQKDYAKLHPSGAIGRSITLTIKDIMRPIDKFPTVLPTTKVRDVLLEMTKCRAGSAAVVNDNNKLLGIFTDGDFRRHITKTTDILEQDISLVMTNNPITVSPESMAIAILKIIENRKIDDILVLNNNKQVVGLVDVQDLPSFKII